MMKYNHSYGIWSKAHFVYNPSNTIFCRGLQKDKMLTKIDNDFPSQCMPQAKHNDGQTEEHIYHNHGNASLVEAAIMAKKKSKQQPHATIMVK